MSAAASRAEVAPGCSVVVDPTAGDAPFRQITAQITDAVARGTLAPGVRLPAVRALADALGVAPGTTAKAYRELEAAGVCESRGRSGTFVAPPAGVDRAVREAAEELARRCVAAGVGLDDAVAAVRAAFPDPAGRA